MESVADYEKKVERGVGLVLSASIRLAFLAETPCRSRVQAYEAGGEDHMGPEETCVMAARPWS